VIEMTSGAPWLEVTHQAMDKVSTRRREDKWSEIPSKNLVRPTSDVPVLLESACRRGMHVRDYLDRDGGAPLSCIFAVQADFVEDAKAG